MTASGMKVIVVGGGLAGMAAALALEQAGCAVTLIESRRTLGGRAGSFEDPQLGIELDNCQHVLLGCCTNLIDFYRRTGALRHIRFEPAIYFTDPAGRRFTLRGTAALPAPLHLAGALFQSGWLTWSERRALATAMLAIMRLDPAELTSLANQPFGDWLDRHRQLPSLLRKVYDPILISALNEQTRAAAASYAIQVLRESLLVNNRGNWIGLPTCPLGQLYASFPAKDVRTGTRVAAVRIENGVAVGVDLQSGEFLAADAVVLAVHHANALRQVSADLAAADSRFVAMQQLIDVPILGAHLWFDRPIIDVSHTALIDGPLQWLFRKDENGSAVHGVISAARDWLDIPRDTAADQFARQICATFPVARGAKLLRHTIVIEKRATFSPLPGSDAHRPQSAPPPSGGLQNLYLAGDYTQTAWPATMEGAVRSGYLATETILAARGNPRKFLVPDLPPQWPARLLAGQRQGY
jgi:squalene-associated FAD-dependent desaturase